MNTLPTLSAFSLLLLTASLCAKPASWNQFRGPNGDGDAGDASLPLVFNEGHQNITWKTPVTGKAWSSPVVRDGMVWMTNALLDGKKMWAVCLDFETGKMLHETLVFQNEKPQFSRLLRTLRPCTAQRRSTPTRSTRPLSRLWLCGKPATTKRKQEHANVCLLPARHRRRL